MGHRIISFSISLTVHLSAITAFPGSVTTGAEGEVYCHKLKAPTFWDQLVLVCIVRGLVYTK